MKWSEVLFTKRDFSQSLRPFVFLHKLFGLMTFKFPSKFYATCPYGSMSTAINLLLVIAMAVIMLLVDSSIHKSRVFVTGMKIIMKTTAFYCLLVLCSNLFVGKQFFKILKNFEKFDESFHQEMPQSDVLLTINGAARMLLLTMWIFKNAYIFLIFSRRWSQVSFLLVIYEHSLIRMGDEQFVFLCYHLLERIKVLNSSASR